MAPPDRDPKLADVFDNHLDQFPPAERDRRARAALALPAPSGPDPEVQEWVEAILAVTGESFTGYERGHLANLLAPLVGRKRRRAMMVKDAVVGFAGFLIGVTIGVILRLATR